MEGKRWIYKLPQHTHNANSKIIYGDMVMLQLENIEGILIDPTLLLMHMKRLEGGNQSADRLLAAGGNYIKNHTHPLVYALPTPSRQFRYV